MTDATKRNIAESGRGWHDMGGAVSGVDAPAIEASEHDYALWEKRVDALMIIASAKGLMTVDSLRRVLEDMGEESFETMTYYERWIASVTRNMIEAGVFTIGELNARMEEVVARGPTYGEAQSPHSPAPARGRRGGGAAKPRPAARR